MLSMFGLAEAALLLLALCMLAGCRGTSRTGYVGVVQVPPDWPTTGVAVENWAHEAVTVRLRSTTGGRIANAALTVPSGARRVVLPTTVPGRLDLHMVTSFPRSLGGEGLAATPAWTHIGDYSLTIPADRRTLLLFRPMGSPKVILLRYVSVRWRSLRLRGCTYLGDDVNGIKVLNDRRPPVTIKSVSVKCAKDEFSMDDLPPHTCWFRALILGPPAQTATAKITFSDGHVEQMDAFDNGDGLLSFHVE